MENKNLIEKLSDLIKPVVKRAEHTRANVAENPEYIIIPKGSEVKSLKPILDEYATRPERKKGDAGHHSLASYIEHFNRFKNESSASYLDIINAKLVGVLDYHKAGDGDPDFGEHRSNLKLEKSPEWLAWKAVNGNTIQQQDFAEFLEDRLEDIYHCHSKEDMPKGATALEMNCATPPELIKLSKSLSINVDKKVVNKINLDSGETEVVFSEEHKTEEGEKTNIPNCFVITIPVFRGEMAYKMLVRLRHRIKSGGGVNFKIDIHRMDLAYLDALEDVFSTIGEKTERDVFKGRPE